MRQRKLRFAFRCDHIDSAIRWMTVDGLVN